MLGSKLVHPPGSERRRWGGFPGGTCYLRGEAGAAPFMEDWAVPVSPKGLVIVAKSVSSGVLVLCFRVPGFFHQGPSLCVTELHWPSSIQTPLELCDS